MRGTVIHPGACAWEASTCQAMVRVFTEKSIETGHLRLPGSHLNARSALFYSGGFTAPCFSGPERNAPDIFQLGIGRAIAMQSFLRAAKDRCLGQWGSFLGIWFLSLQLGLAIGGYVKLRMRRSTCAKLIAASPLRARRACAWLSSGLGQPGLANSFSAKIFRCVGREGIRPPVTVPLPNGSGDDRVADSPRRTWRPS